MTLIYYFCDFVYFTESVNECDKANFENLNLKVAGCFLDQSGGCPHLEGEGDQEGGRADEQELRCLEHPQTLKRERECVKRERLILSTGEG